MLTDDSAQVSGCEAFAMAHMHRQTPPVCVKDGIPEGHKHNRKKEQLVASAVVASQQIPASSVILAKCAGQPALVMSQHSASTQYQVQVNSTAQTCTCPQGQLHYPCKHVMKVISMTTGKSGPEIIMALGTWAGTELGGLNQLQSTDDAMAQLKDNFMLSDAEVGKAQPDSTGKVAETEQLTRRTAQL